MAFTVQMTDGSKRAVEASDAIVDEGVLLLRDSSGRGVAAFGGGLWLSAVRDGEAVEAS